MSHVELRMSFSDLTALERELAQNLKYGRAFLPEVADASVLSDCVLVLVHPDHAAELHVTAQIVMLSADGPMRGTGVELRPFNAAVQAELGEFVHSAAKEAEPAMEDAANESELAADTGEDQGISTSSAETSDEGPAFDEDLSLPDDTELEPPVAQGSLRPDGQTIPPDVQVESKQDKLRHLSATEQIKVARKGELSDRLVVERLYGKQVWEALLQNPRLTIPEVARIARKGSVPKPLIEQIVENATWIKAPQVRRALLTNPKVGSDSILKLLRLTPKHELKLIEKGTAYAPPVREAARKLLKQ